jgi:hypothetical protein
VLDDCAVVVKKSISTAADGTVTCSCCEKNGSAATGVGPKADSNGSILGAGACVTVCAPGWFETGVDGNTEPRSGTIGVLNRSSCRGAWA